MIFHNFCSFSFYSVIFVTRCIYSFTVHQFNSHVNAEMYPNFQKQVAENRYNVFHICGTQIVKYLLRFYIYMDLHEYYQT